MEPPPKRLRLFGPAKSEPTFAFDSDNCSDLYDDEDTTLEVEEGDEDTEPGDPDAQLEQTRAQLDLKLKSKFEAIFEKYGRDFTGIGDEIDLRTGEIIVDNGHLLEMEDERDDGTARPSLLDAFTQEPHETAGSTDAGEDEQDEVHESHLALEDMEEDDMILFQNATVSSLKPTTPPPRSSLREDRQPGGHQEDNRPAAAPNTSFPSESEILAQFGQDLGPKIARYVSQQRAQDDSVIEPAWRTPGLPLATPGKRPILKSILLQPDNDRSPSPKGMSSVWAPKMPRGRPRRDGADVAAVFRGETIIRDRTWYSSGYVSTTVTKQHTERVGLSQPKHTLSAPLKKTFARGMSGLEPGPWAQTKETGPSVIYDMSCISDEEPDSSEEKVAKYYKPRRSWSIPGLAVGQKIKGNLHPQTDQPRHRGKEDSSFKRSRKPYVAFTEADDETLLEWVEEALKKGFTLWSPTHWKMLAEKNPRHTHLSWMDRYRRRFWQKEIIPSISKENYGELSGAEIDVPEYVLTAGALSQSQLEDGFCGDNFYEALRGAPQTKPRTIPEKVFSQTEPITDLKVEAVDRELLDPALRSPVVIDCITKEEPDRLCLERPILSQSPAVDFKRGSSVPCITSEDLSIVKGARSSSVPQQIGPQAKSSTPPNREAHLRVDDAKDVEKDHHLINDEGTVAGSRIESSQIMLSTNSGTAYEALATSEGGQKPPQIPQKNLGSSYDFSDDEDEIKLMQPSRPFHFQLSSTITNKRPVEKQIIDLTGEDSVTARYTTMDRRAEKVPPRKVRQSPISISSASPSSDLSEVGEESFFLKPSTPSPPVSDSNMTLSGILGDDDFDELRRSSPAQKKQKPLENLLDPETQEVRSVFNRVRSSPASNPTPSRRTPISIGRASILRRSMEGSPSGPVIKTPGGSKRRCGENGFSCGKGFCFKCLEG